MRTEANARPRPGCVGALLALALVGVTSAPIARATSLSLLAQRTELAGLAHHAGPAVWAAIADNATVDLVREPGNVHDPRAVRVDWQGTALGYLPHRQNDGIAWALDRGEILDARLRRHGQTRAGRPRFDIELRLR